MPQPELIAQVLPSSVCVACYIKVVLTLSLLLALATSPELPQFPALGRMLNYWYPERDSNSQNASTLNWCVFQFRHRGINIYMKSYYVLDYEGPFVRDSLQLNVEKNDTDWTVLNPPLWSLVTRQGLHYIHFNLKFKHAYDSRIYVGKPRKSTKIHTDTAYDTISQNKPVLSYALNYVFTNTEAKMRWFYPARPDVATPRVNNVGGPYMIFESEKGLKVYEEIDFPINKLVLVRIDVPHQVTNCSYNTRYCLSMRGQPVLNWKDAVDYFSPHFVNGS